MKHFSNRAWTTSTWSALALVLALGASQARADDFNLTIRVPVNFDHLSPKVLGMQLNCSVYDAHGKDLRPYIKDDTGTNTWIDSNVRHFNGTLTYTFTFDQDQAMKLDWGSYACSIYFYADGGADYPTVGNPRDMMQLLPGAVVLSKGSLF